MNFFGLVKKTFFQEQLCSQKKAHFLLMKDFKNKNNICDGFQPLKPKYRVKSFLWIDVQISCLGMWIYVIEYKMSLGNIKH